MSNMTHEVNKQTMEGQKAPSPPAKLAEAGGEDAIGVPQLMKDGAISTAPIVQPDRIKRSDRGRICREPIVAVPLLLTL